MNVALPLKFINLKGVGWDAILPYIKTGIMYAVEWFLIGIVLYSARIALSKYRNKKISKEEDEKISIETYIDI